MSRVRFFIFVLAAAILLVPGAEIVCAAAVWRGRQHQSPGMVGALVFLFCIGRFVPLATFRRLRHGWIEER
jgi:hypothetical protein